MVNNFPGKYFCLIICLTSSYSWAAPTHCSYTTYRWNVEQRKAVMIDIVSKPYKDVTPEERDSVTGCSVCEQDQVSLNIAHLPEIKVCHLLANQIKSAIEAALQEGQYLKSAVGYRVGRTRGEIDSQGNRTQFSNHSFGIAIDFNVEFNGLYNNCVSFNEQCQLIKGGVWHYHNPGSLKLDSPIVFHMKQAGFKWGGEILGKQKDFMHFSLTGY